VNTALLIAAAVGMPLREDLDFLGAPGGGWPWWAWALVTLVVTMALAAGAFVAWRCWRRRQQAAGTGEDPAPPRPGVSPEEWALEQLRALRAELSAERGYPFAISVSRVLRHYIEYRHEIVAPRMTTLEFLEATTRWKPFADYAARSLEHFLRSCDAIKFARRGAGESQLRELLDLAERFVRQSAPQPESAAREPATRDA
jgi:hypothetical protein